MECEFSEAPFCDSHSRRRVAQIYCDSEMSSIAEWVRFEGADSMVQHDGSRFMAKGLCRTENGHVSRRRVSNGTKLERELENAQH
jgi:hypothetical protein